MARRRGAGSGRGDLPDVDDVLAGRVEPTVLELVELIVRVNPTDRGLPPGEQTRRYRTKSRLQGLLIRRFGDALDVSIDDTSPDNVVLLRHTASGRTAGHAPLDSLEPDARSWAQRRLDEERAGTRAARPPHAYSTAAEPSGGEGPPASPLEAGTAALDAYDLELARTCFEQAFEASSGGLAAATALALVLVDHLADYAAAAALHDRLAPDARDDAPLRGLLAVAAARAGEERTALRLLASLDGPRAVQAHTALGERALERASLEEATRRRDAAHAAGPEDDALRAFSRRLDAARADARRPAEAEIERLLAAGDVHAAAERGRSLVREAPDNRAARRAIRAAEEAARARDRALLLATGDGASERGDWEAAAEAYERAAAIESSPDLALRVADVRARQRALELERAVGAVREALHSKDLATGLVAYAGASGEVRSGVHGAHDLPHLGWIDEMDRARTPIEAASAALALARGLEALAADQPADALAALAPHQRALSGVGDAEELTHAAHASIRASAVHRALTALSAVEHALGDLDKDALARGIASVDAAALEPVDRIRHDALTQRLDELRAAEHVGHRFARCMANDEPFAARELAHGALARADESGRAVWADRLAEAERAIRTTWATVEVDPAGDDLRDADLFHMGTEDVGCTLSPDGTDVLIAEAIGDRLLLRTLAVGTPRVTRSGWIVAPRNLEPLFDVHRDAERIAFATQAGEVVEIDATTWAVVANARVQHYLDRSDRAVIEHLWIVPGRRVWVHTRQLPGNEVATHAIDLASGSRRRVPGAPWQVWPCEGQTDEFVVAALAVGDREEFQVLDLDGRPWSDLRPFGTRDRAVNAAVLPGDPGFLMVYGTSLHDDEDGPLRIAALHFEAHRRNHTCALGSEVAGSTWQGSHAIATSLDDATSFLLYDQVEAGRRSLAAIVVDPATGPTPAYTLGILGEARLVRNAGSRRVALLSDSTRGIEVRPLGSVAPDVTNATGLTPPTRRDRMAMSDVAHCVSRTATSDLPYMQELAAHFKAVPLKDLGPTAREVWDRHADAPDTRLLLIQALPYRGANELRRELLVELHHDHPLNLSVALELAQLEVRDASWSEVRRILAAIDPGPYPRNLAGHLHHVLGLALLHTGEPGAAVEQWEAGLVANPSDGCNLATLVAARRPDASPTAPMASRLAAVAHVADQCRATGDVAGARRVLGRAARSLHPGG